MASDWPDEAVLLAGRPGEGAVYGCWSMSLVRGEHAGDVFCVGTPVDTAMTVYMHRQGVRPTGVIGSDGGFGRGQMAIAGLGILERLGIACAAVSHLSADLGDAGSICREGRVTRANEQAQAAGVAVGMTAMAAAAAMLRGARG
ncbi:MAG: hypothetical protein M0002_08595 [Rhodospirillales bacterium]|nr:hypothetical protein [Rhodospirillales bacterium]